MALQQAFIEEIDFNELEFREIVGRGAFGVVSRARWRSIDVAVKLIETESEKKAFITELKQLSRVNHVNIVKLYGASTKQPVCLVMEYAEGGSLYNILHGSTSYPNYTAAHAMSWCLQCARGVEYLHGMKPKPLVHRDLKPPNLLLISRCTVLKICDFGTACDAHTHMTNNKGSAAWMAPEVFEGNNYSEKCDVFSWGIILWEVITRRKPFDEIGGPAFRIMWAVHNGTRPPLIKNCPAPLELLMTRCWSANPFERPSMAEVVRIMSHLFQFFSGADEPLQYAVADPNQTPKASDTPLSTYDNPQFTGASQTRDSRSSTMQDTIQQVSNPFGTPVLRVAPPVPPKPPFMEDNSRTSAPASLQASSENLVDHHRPNLSTVVNEPSKRYSADLSNLQASEQQFPTRPFNADNDVPAKPIPPELPQFEFEDGAFPGTFPLISAQQQYLQPLPPCPTSPESVAIYQQHCQLSEEYLRIQAEIAILLQRRKELMVDCQKDETERLNNRKLKDDYQRLLVENDSLKLLQDNLTKQLAQCRQQSNRPNRM